MAKRKNERDRDMAFKSDFKDNELHIQTRQIWPPDLVPWHTCTD